jgi:hypothetical protein
MKLTNVTKASGEVVPFSKDKLGVSLQRAGASKETIDYITTIIKKQLFEGITTKEIYRNAFALLQKASKSTAAKYKLKQAIMELGPTGFPFEKYISEILKHQGYRVKVGEVLKGHCVNHEVDVIAEKDEYYFIIECKYHNLQGINCDVKVPLYIHSRFQDIKRKWMEQAGNGTKKSQGWVVTNTKFTNDAIKYGKCAELHMIGWDYPFKNGLREMIDRSGLYPVTCLSTLSAAEKKRLLDDRIVLCRDVVEIMDTLSFANISEKRRRNILEEVKSLCEIHLHNRSIN